MEQQTNKSSQGKRSKKTNQSITEALGCREATAKAGGAGGAT